jgi:hypothetical protein
VGNAVLVTRPRHDLITNYLYYWSIDLLRMAKEKGMNVFDLERKKATRQNLESYTRKQSPSLVFLNGHGNANVITGDADKPILDAKSKLSTSVMYARSCDAAAGLGKVMVAGSTKSFIGYRRKFTLSYTVAHTTKPLSDPLARLFLEPSNLVVSTIIKGHPAQEAHNRSQEAMRKNFRKMMSSQATDDERYAARWLWANVNSQVLLGDPSAKV